MNAVDTGFVIICATLVMVMTPALALFYGGLVQARNVLLSTSMLSYASLGLITILWAIAGYSLAFGADSYGLIGNFEFFCLKDVEGVVPPMAEQLPHTVFVAFQCMFAVLTVALVSDSYAERIKFSRVSTN